MQAGGVFFLGDWLVCKALLKASPKRGGACVADGEVSTSLRLSIIEIFTGEFVLPMCKIFRKSNDTFSVAGKSIQKAPCEAAPLDSGDYLAHFSGRGGLWRAGVSTSAAQLKNVPLVCVLP